MWFQDVTNHGGHQKRVTALIKFFRLRGLMANGILRSPHLYLGLSSVSLIFVDFHYGTGSICHYEISHGNFHSFLQTLSHFTPFISHSYSTTITNVSYGALCLRFNSSRSAVWWMSRLKDDPTTLKALIKSFNMNQNDTRHGTPYYIPNGISIDEHHVFAMASVMGSREYEHCNNYVTSYSKTRIWPHVPFPASTQSTYSKQKSRSGRLTTS